MGLALFIVLTQAAQERAYPLSNFPMYSNPSEWDDYLYMTDDKDAVLPISAHTSLSAAKMMKIFNNRMKTVGLKRSEERKNPPKDKEAEVGAYVVQKAREIATKNGTPLPEKVRVYRVIIQRTGDTITETPRLVFEG